MQPEDKKHIEDHLWIGEQRKQQATRAKRHREMLLAAAQWIGTLVAGAISAIFTYFLSKH